MYPFTKIYRNTESIKKLNNFEKLRRKVRSCQGSSGGIGQIIVQSSVFQSSEGKVSSEAFISFAGMQIRLPLPGMQISLPDV